MDITLVTFHFGDSFWIKKLLSSVEIFKDTRIKETIIVDQSRNSAHWLKTLPNVHRVLTFPEEKQQVRLLGHDHPSSLNRVIRETDFFTSHVLIMDSDCFPIRHGWLEGSNDITLAGVPNSPGLSHSCFMLLPVKLCYIIDFQEGIETLGMDTGRLVSIQLARAGYSVSVSAPIAAFNGLRGHFYMNGGLYHHGSASFIHAPDNRLRKQVNLRSEPIFRGHVEKDEFHLYKHEILRFFVQRTFGKFFSHIRGLFDTFK